MVLNGCRVLWLFFVLGSLVAMMKDVEHDSYMAEYFRANPNYAVDLLVEVTREGSLLELSILLKQVEEAFAL